MSVRLHCPLFFLGLTLASCGSSTAVNNSHVSAATGGHPGSGGEEVAASGGTPGTGGSATGVVGSGGGPDGTGGAEPMGTGGMPPAGTGGEGPGGKVGSGGQGQAGGGASGGQGMPGAGGSNKSCPGLLLCDDFESYAASSPPSGQWRVTGQGSSTITVDTMQAKSGTKAAHFHGTVGANGANAVYMVADSPPLFPVNANVLFVRFMMYVKRYPTGSPMHTRLAWLGTTGMNRNQDGSGYVMNTYNGIAIEKLTGSGMRDTSQHMTDAVNTGKWLCWEFEINNTEGPPPQSSGKVLPRMWREGQPMSLAISGTGITWAPAPFNLLQFALFAYQADTAPADFWIDDIAMNNQRIGCPQ